MASRENAKSPALPQESLWKAVVELREWGKCRRNKKVCRESYSSWEGFHLVPQS